MTAPFSPRLLAIGGLLAMASAIGVGRFIYTPILPLMADDLHLSKGDAGLIASANFLGYLLGAIGAASPRMPGSLRGWLLAMLAVGAVTTGAMAFARDMPTFLALRFVGGVASAFVLVLASALVLERLNATGYGNYASVHFYGVGTGIAACALLTWLLSSAGADWRAMWLGGGLLSAVALAAAIVLIPGAERRSPTTAAGGAASDPRLKQLTLAYGLFGFGYIITATFLVVIVRGSPAAASHEPIFFLLLGLAGIPSVAFWVAVAKRLGIIRAFASACLVEAFGVFVSVAWPNTTGLVIASVLVGGTFMGITALGLIAGRELAPENPRRWFAILTAAFGLGQILGPAVAGYGFDLTGSFYLPSMLAVIALCASAVLAFIVGRRRIA